MHLAIQNVGIYAIDSVIRLPVSVMELIGRYFFLLHSFHDEWRSTSSLAASPPVKVAFAASIPYY